MEINQSSWRDLVPAWLGGAKFTTTTPFRTNSFHKTLFLLADLGKLFNVWQLKLTPETFDKYYYFFQFALHYLS